MFFFLQMYENLRVDPINEIFGMEKAVATL